MYGHCMFLCGSVLDTAGETRCTGIESLDHLTSQLAVMGETAVDWELFARELGLTWEQFPDKSLMEGKDLQPNALQVVAK